MNAPVSLLDVAAEKREERRRVRTIENMRATMHAIGIELGRIQTLGNTDRVRALSNLRSRFAHMDLTALSLLQEAQELAALEPESVEG